MTYYFTYGTDGYPFCGGWTEIEANTKAEACSLFRAVHPDKLPGVLNCSFVYSEDQFMNTVMYKNGNYGFFMKERISLEQEGSP